MIRYSRSTKPRAFSTRKPADVRRPEVRRIQCSNCCPRCCSSVKSDAACNRLCPRCCDTRGRTPDPRTSSRPGSRTGSPSRRAYPNWTDEDQEALVERELRWRDRGMPEDTRVYASMLVRHNIAPEQLLFEAGCSDYQDDLAFPILAQAAENLMRVGYDSTDDDDA